MHEFARTFMFYRCQKSYSNHSNHTQFFNPHPLPPPLFPNHTQIPPKKPKGFYHILDAEGRVRRVDYTAGPEGFKATIQSNEEGLVSGESADARFNVDNSRTIRQQ